METLLVFAGWCTLWGLVGALTAIAALVLYDAWLERDR